MNYDEFVNYDKLGAYAEFSSVHTAIERGILPKEYEGVIPEKCTCGSDLIISYNLKTIRCCDPHCWVKMSYAMAHMFSNFGCQNLGPATCESIVKYLNGRNFFEIPSHLEILKLSETNKGNLESVLGARWYDLLQGLAKIKTTKMTFGKMVGLVSLPYLDKSCEQLFNDINHTRDFIEIGRTTGLLEYMASKGVKDTKKSVSFVSNLKALMIFESNLIQPLLTPGLFTRKVCITGSVQADGANMTRQEFLKYLNNVSNYEGIQIFEFIETGGPETVDHIIADRPSNTRKYLAGKSREAKGESNIIVTAQTYVDLVREEVRLCIEKATE